LLAGLLLAPGVARADVAPQLIGLFIQGCMPFAGNPGALRAWAAQAGLPAVPEQARVAFLHGAPGQVFDGSTAEGKLVLVSSDDGICSVVTDQAVQTAVVEALEAGLQRAGAAFRLAIERDDKAVPEIHDREYLATKDGRGWRVLLAAVKGDKGGEAMLTAAPEVDTIPGGKIR
jgi:hypothetical protein